MGRKARGNRLYTHPIHCQGCPICNLRKLERLLGHEVRSIRSPKLDLLLSEPFSDEVKRGRLLPTWPLSGGLHGEMYKS